MIDRRGFAAVIAAVAVSASASGSVAAQPELAVGQLWSIKASPPSSAKVLIDRIEPWGQGRTIVHVTIIDVPPSLGLTVIGHAPFDKAAIEASIDQLLATNVPIPATFEGGYAQWKSAHGGVFTVTVDQAIAFIAKTLQSAHPAAPRPAT